MICNNTCVGPNALSFICICILYSHSRSYSYLTRFGQFSRFFFGSHFKVICLVVVGPGLHNGAPSFGLKWPGREANHSNPSSTEVRNMWNFISTSLLLHGMVPYYEPTYHGDFRHSSPFFIFSPCILRDLFSLSTSS